MKFILLTAIFITAHLFSALTEALLPVGAQLTTFEVLVGFALTRVIDLDLKVDNL